MNTKFALLTGFLLLFSVTVYLIHPFKQNSDYKTCRFAKQYTQEELFLSQSLRLQFLDEVLHWESFFIQGIGYHEKTGMTLDGQRLDVTTGEPFGQPHMFTASSKESLQVGILARVFYNDPRTSHFYTVDEAIKLLQTKLNTYENFFQTHPGFGWYLPWVFVSDEGIRPTNDFMDRTPGLDNGQLFWAAYALSFAWEKNYPFLRQDLRSRWENVWQNMIQYSHRMFWAGDGQIRTVSVMKDPYRIPEVQTYDSPNPCGYPCYLNDPYEGELFALMMYLFTPELNDADREAIFNQKIKQVFRREYELKQKQINITVEQGFWFSSHEVWKHMFLPYNLSNTHWTIFKNGEQARTWNSAIKNIPGLYASVTGTANQNEDNLDYNGDYGIPEIAENPIGHTQIVTPYGSYPLFFISDTYGAIWYHNMINGPSGQTLYGSIEGLNITGHNVSPMTTWDTQATTVLAMLGGTIDINMQALESAGKLNAFVQFVQKLYSTVFKDKINGEDIDFSLPSVKFPKGKNDFTTCN